jgi:hypothetical protein
MIKLIVPAIIGGRLISAGKVVVAPADLEKRLISAGNAERVDPDAKSRAFEEEFDAELLKKVEELKLDLPDGLSPQQVRDAVNAALQELAAKNAANADPGGAAASTDAEKLNLGRGGVQQ